MKNYYLIPNYKVQLVRDGSTRTTERKQITTPRGAAFILQAFLEPETMDREEFVILTLDTKNKVTGCHSISTGCLSSSIVHPREVFKPAILASAASVVLCHNHPSGDPHPSSEDIEVTARLVAAGKVLGIPVRDHIILGDDNAFYSFRENDILPV